MDRKELRQPRNIQDILNRCKNVVAYDGFWVADCPICGKHELMIKDCGDKADVKCLEGEK